MARQKKRKAFPTDTKRGRFEVAVRSNEVDNTFLSTERSGIFGFLSDRGVRETIESIVVAIVLALVFRAFEAEAFVIPTGSMAPSLQGQHRDIHCEQCNYLYQTGDTQSREKHTTNHTFCPICQYKTKMKETTNPDHRSNNGDRILVNKFIYDFADPKRFDVIVFKNPNNGKQNYIKRLVGLPGEDIIIENGDLFLYEKVNEDSDTRTIIRKPNHKLEVMMQLVDDTDYIPQKMHDAGWPLRWQQWGSKAESESNWNSFLESGKPTYEINAEDETKWLRYRHLIPLSRESANLDETYEWEEIIEGELPKRIARKNPMGRLITDYYCYNHRILRNAPYDSSPGLAWVGDLGTEFWCEVKSNSGELVLEVVEGGAKFVCTIDVETGKATLSSDSKLVDFVDSDGSSVEVPTAQTKLVGAGSYRIFFANIDDQIRLSINKKFVDFDAATFVRNERVMPTSLPNDKSNLGDAEPISIGAKNANLEISRLKVLRDIYYTSPKDMHQDFIENETGLGFKGDKFPRSLEYPRIWEWFDNPADWDSPNAKAFFNSRFREKPYVFKLKEDQFLPMGDNSPASLDGRVWNGPKFVNRDMLIGRASFIYWPHSLNSPIKFFPNFKKMKFIH